MSQRTERAFRALLQAQYTEGGADTMEDAVCDLLTDLIHLSNEYNFDAAEVFARAQGHAEAEAEAEAANPTTGA